MSDLFTDLLQDTKIQENLAANSAKTITVLEPGVHRVFCESCREIINLAKVSSWTCPCGNTWQLAPSF